MAASAYNKHVVAAGLLVLAALLKVGKKDTCLLLVFSKTVFYLIIVAWVLTEAVHSEMTFLASPSYG